MIRIVNCIALEHDPWLLLLAVLVSVTGGAATITIYDRVTKTVGAQRQSWLLLAGVAAGATVWSTHFVSMLAYRTNVPTTIDPLLTLGSLVIAMGGATIAFRIKLFGSSRRWRLPIAGTLLGGTISAMHFLGMAGYRFDGIVEWDTGYVIAAITGAIIFSTATLGVMRQEELRFRRVTATALFAVAVVTLHFVAMAALTVYPMALSDSPMTEQDTLVLAIGTAILSLFVIMTGVAATLIDRETRSEALTRLRIMATTDSVTGLANRIRFRNLCEAALHRGTQRDQSFAIVAIDLNRFKEVNDLHGHQTGDELLKAVAARLAAFAKRFENAAAARVGGDEFALLVPFDHRAELVHRLSTLMIAIEEPYPLSEIEAAIGASMGVATFPDDGEDVAELAKNADLAMYRSKRSSDESLSFYSSELDLSIRKRRQLANDLRIAMAAGDQLNLHYQPQIDIESGAVTGFEALLRWTHPTRGRIGPDEFIPLAEEYGLIYRLGEWALRLACREASGWTHRSRVAVNLSPLQLSQQGLPDLIRDVLAETLLPASRLEIELTESALLSSKSRALAALRRIQNCGVHVALDDFGTGYSSLDTLRSFPFDKLKLDRAFISNIGKSEQDTAIVRAVVTLGKSLGMPVLAEGVETIEQYRILRAEGCDEAQGYLIGAATRRPTFPASNFAPSQSASRPVIAA